MSFEYPPETGFGGIGTYTWYHARALAKLGHDVHVLAGATESTPIRTFEHDGVTVFRFRSANFLSRLLLPPLERFRLWWTKNRVQNALSMYAGLRILQRQHRYDIIEMPECGAEGTVINRLVRTPTLVRLHSPARLIMPFYDVLKADITLCSLVEKGGMNAAGSFTSCSSFLADEARLKLGVRRSIPVIPNGIDLCLFDGQEDVDFRDRFGLPRDRPIIFFAGRIERRKGAHLLRQIAKEILERHDVAMVVAGQDLFDYMKREIEPGLDSSSLRGSFHYLGKLGLTEIRSGVRQCEIFLLPSLWENCPYSCLEAMAAGRAVVSTDQGGMPEMITDGASGLLARSGDAASFTAAIERLLLDDELRARLGEGARTAIEANYRDIHTAHLAAENYARLLGAAA